MKYKAVLFDIDGTLLDTASMNIIPLMKILEKELHKTYTYEELTPLVAFSGTVILKKMGIPDENNERVLHDWIEEIQQSGMVSTPFEGIFYVLEELHKRGVPMGIISSKEKKQYQFDVVNNHMDHFFDTVILADDTKLHKPHPDPMLACLSAMNLKPEEAIYIGDCDADGICASACGCDFAYAAWGPLELTVDCTYRLEKPEDLLHIIGEEWNGKVKTNLTKWL